MGGGYSAAHTRPAFTLIELIVVIGIIVLLTALTVTVAVGVVSKSEVRATENTLKLLDLAVQEWETESGRKITWGVDDEPFDSSKYDIQPDTPQYVSDYDARTMLNIVLDKIGRNPAAADIFRQIDSAYLKRIDATIDSEEVQVLEVLDAWEQPIWVIHPGRVADPRTYQGATNPQNSDIDVFTDEDGTIRVGHPSQDFSAFHLLLTTITGGVERGYESRLGVCKNRRICFVSRGPDGDFGDLSAEPDTDDYEATLDNVYSYPVEQP